jgi:retron-type reverse transcriptase
MQSFQKDKIPGPDGWNIEFYLGFFELIGKDILKVVEESKLNGIIHGPLNSTFITLIPKVNGPLSFDEFRPISLCNCIYKIIAKIIARRLKPILSKSISKEQFGFLEGRQIHEAIGVAQEGLHRLKTKKEKGTILKIDLSKAFDRVNCSYIRLLLTHIGFDVPFIKWIMACISLISFAVLINGVASPFFISKKGF